MKLSTALTLSVIIALGVLAYTLTVYPRLPDQIPIHWNAAGKIDHYGSKSTVWFYSAMPVIGILMMLILPWLSPQKFKIDTFRATFNYIMFIISGMFGFIGFVLVYATINPAFDMTKILFSGMFLFFGLLGNLMGKIQKNFFVGIRTPWTLASDKVWVATHRLGARLMTAAGLLGAVAIWLGAPIMVTFCVVIAVILYPAVYSLIIYKQLESKQAL